MSKSSRSKQRRNQVKLRHQARMINSSSNSSLGMRRLRKEMKSKMKSNPMTRRTVRSLKVRRTSSPRRQ